MNLTEFKGGATISRGVEWDDNLSDIAPDLWPELIGAYRFFCERRLPTDCRSLLRMISEGEKVGWASYGDREAYLRDGLGLDPDAVDWALLGLRVVGAEVPVPFQDAQTIGQRAAMLAGPDGVSSLSAHGGDRVRPQENGEQAYIVSLKHGNSAAYLVARLKRDHPAIAARLANGEFRSARAAARAAGLKVDTPPLTILRRAWEKASAEEREIFFAEIRHRMRGPAG
jgi:hypothetical protein